MYFFCDVIISKLGKKGSKVVYHVSKVIERSKSIFDGTLKWGEFVSVINLSKYWNFMSLSKNWVKRGPNFYFIYQLFELTISKFWLFWKFWVPAVTSSTQKWLKKLRIGISCINVDRKIRGKGTFKLIIPLWNRSLKILKFWLNVLTSSTQNWLEKGSKLISLVRMVTEK